MEARKIVIAGIGGAGCRIIDGLYDGLEGTPLLAAVNTDVQALANGRATTKIQIGSDCTRGLGLAGDAETGRKAALDDVEMLRGLFTDSALIIITAGLGGGTGSGATPVVVDIAKKSGALVIVFVTLPFDFEGRRKIRLADDALAEIRDLADTVFVVPNERLFRFVNMENLAGAFAAADEVLQKGIASIWRMLTMPAYIRIDLADLQRVGLSTGGTATFAYGEGAGKNRAEDALSAMLKSPMILGGKVLQDAEAVLVSLTGGPDMALSEVGLIMNGIRGAVSDEENIRVGTIVDPAWDGRIGVSIFASEHWVERESGDDAGELKSSGAGKKQYAVPKQIQIDFIPGKGRFKDVEPTIMNGEDLDVPTFIRRGISLEKVVS